MYTVYNDYILVDVSKGLILSLALHEILESLSSGLNATVMLLFESVTPMDSLISPK